MNPSRSEGAAQLAGCNPKPEPEPVTNWTNQDSLNKTTLTHSAPQTQARARTRARISRLRIPFFFLFFLFFCLIFFFFLSLSLFPSSFISIDIHTFILLTIVYAVCLFFLFIVFSALKGGFIYAFGFVRLYVAYYTIYHVTAGVVSCIPFRQRIIRKNYIVRLRFIPSHSIHTVTVTVPVLLLCCVTLH